MIKDLFIYPEEILNETQEIESEAANLALKFSLLSQKVKYLLLKIESSSSIESAEEYFDLLDKIQTALASIAFKHDIGLPEGLHNFVQAFDNIDHYKNYLFQQIKSGKTYL